MVNWSLTVSDDIDQSVRRFLAEQDGEERDMAVFAISCRTYFSLIYFLKKVFKKFIILITV